MFHERESAEGEKKRRGREYEKMEQNRENRPKR